VFSACLAVGLACGNQRRLTGSGSASEVFATIRYTNTLLRYFYIVPLLIAGESPSSTSSVAVIGSQRFFPAVLCLGCEALTMILVQCAAADDLATSPSAQFTVGELLQELCPSVEETIEVRLDAR